MNAGSTMLNDEGIEGAQMLFGFERNEQKAGADLFVGLMG